MANGAFEKVRQVGSEITRWDAGDFRNSPNVPWRDEPPVGEGAPMQTKRLCQAGHVASFLENRGQGDRVGHALMLGYSHP